MTDQQQNHLRDARALIGAALAIVAERTADDPANLADQLEALLVKVSGDLREIAAQ
jgi:hypothetical protein